ncbi:unnamed protein product [Boreogadus saida]
MVAGSIAISKQSAGDGPVGALHVGTRSGYERVNVSSAAGPAAPHSEVLGRTGWAQHKKKIVNSSSPGWAQRWKENSGASGERPCAAARGERHRENRSGSHRRTARRTSTCVTATVYGTMCCETDI